jgi:hypothetical protein
MVVTILTEGGSPPEMERFSELTFPKCGHRKFLRRDPDF